MITDWTNGIVAIYGSSAPAGTGFVVSPGGLIFTCAHVLRQAGWPHGDWSAPVQIRFKVSGRFAIALVQQDCFLSEPEGDIALLLLEEPLPEEVEVLPLSSAATAAGHPIAAWGYPDRHRDGLRGQGSALGLVTQDGRATLQLRSEEITRGYSGGPIWHPVWKRVIGMVLRGIEADALGRQAHTAFAAPAESLVDLCPDRLALSPPEGLIAQATRHIGGANQDLVDGYTGRAFVGRDDALDQLDAWLESNASGRASRRMIVTAPAGFGKTALLANWLRRRQAQGDFTAFHFFSNRDEHLRPLANAYANILAQCAVYFDLPGEELPDENARPARLRALIEDHQPAEDRPLIILLDALDECERPFQLALPTILPEGVYLVASARAADPKEGGDVPPYLEGWTAGAASIHLDSLPEVAQAGWLAAAGDGILHEESQDPAFLARLAQVSQGYPLYLQYLFEDLVEAKRSGRSPMELLDQSANVFGEYVGEQLREVSRAIGREKEIQDFFTLLAVARYALTGDEILDLTELTPFDLADLPPGLTRWLNITHDATGHSIYSFAHAKLAEEFETALRGAARQKRDQLQAWCASVAGHRSPYALRYYAELLFQAQEWPTLYALARDRDFAASQQLVLPAEPYLTLATIRLALQAAAFQDDAPGMAEFLLEHARRILVMRRASPLDVWRNTGDAAGLARAWSLADSNEFEWRLIWLLLLVWELVDGERTAEAEATLARLTPDHLPALTRSSPFITFHLLRRLMPDWPLQLMPVAVATLDDRGKSRLSQKLGRDGQWSLALELVQHVGDRRAKADAQRRLLYLQCEAGLLEQAVTLAGTIAEGFPAALARRCIAEGLAEAGRLDEALLIAGDIPLAGLRAGALARIAVAYGRDQQPDQEEAHFATALAIASSIDDPYDGCLAQKDIAAALHLAGRASQAGQCFAAAATRLPEVTDAGEHDKARRQLALALAWAGRTAGALAAAGGIEDDDSRLEALFDLAAGRSAAGEFAAAFEIAAAVDNDWDRGWLLGAIAKDQAAGGDLDGAQETITRIEPPHEKAWALAELALIRFDSGQAAAASTTLSAAHNLAGQLHSPGEQAREFRHIALINDAMADTDGARAAFAQALQVVTGEMDWDDGKYLRIEIALAQARTGDHRAARDTLASVMAGGHSAQAPATADQVLQKIVFIQADAGAFEAAQDTAGLIVAAWERAETLIQIGTRQATAGAAAPATFTLAMEAAGQIAATDEPDEMRSEIGVAQARAGLIPAALQTAGMLSDVWRRDGILHQIAVHHVRAGEFELALQIAGDIDGREPAAVTYAVIAAGQFQSSNTASGAANFQKALDIAGSITAATARAGAYTRVGAALAGAGPESEASKALELASESASHSEYGPHFHALLQDMVEAGQIDETPDYLDPPAESGDAGHLSELLPLWAQDPQAALSAIPTIAQRHPDQAAAIAAIVANHAWS